MDTDYMGQFSFTYVDDYNPEDWNGFLSSMKELGIRYVPIIEGGVTYAPNNKIPNSTYQLGRKQNVFLKSPTS